MEIYSLISICFLIECSGAIGAPEQINSNKANLINTIIHFVQKVYNVFK